MFVFLSSALNKRGDYYLDHLHLTKLRDDVCMLLGLVMKNHSYMHFFATHYMYRQIVYSEKYLLS